MNYLAPLLYTRQGEMDTITHSGAAKLNRVKLSKYFKILGLEKMKKL